MALIARGVVAAWADDDLSEACDFLSEGVRRADRSSLYVIALSPLAERLARDGRGLAAWKILSVAEPMARALEEEGHLTRLRWIKGVAYRALGELEAAQRELATVHGKLLAEGASFRAALAALDLAAVHAARGRSEEVRRLAAQAHATFVASGVERRALAAFLVFHRAAMADRLSVELAVRVANFLVRRQHHRGLTLELPASGE